MKKKILIMFILTLFIICGCGSNKTKTSTETKTDNAKVEEKAKETKETNTTNKMVGTYMLSSAKNKNKNKTLTKEEINKIKKDHIIIVFDDRNIEIRSGKTRGIGTYNQQYIIGTTGEGKNKKAVEIEYKYDNNKITIYYYSGEYVFEKVK